jgi:hypothetical protein
VLCSCGSTALTQINLPKLTAPLADFIGENAPIPVVQGASSFETSLEPSKFAVIVVLTREVIESGNAEALTRDALLNSTGPALDRRLFDNVAGSAVRPPGLLFGKTALTASTATDKLQAMVGDLSALAASVAPYAGNGGIAFVASAKQATAINIGLSRELPYPLAASTSLADGTVICVAVNALVSAVEGGPVIDTTKSATLHMSDTPQAIANAGTMAAPTTVTFQTDTVGIRLRWPLSWALRNAGAIAFVSGVTWP